MGATLEYSDIRAMMARAAEAIEANHEMLGKLDSVGGDGDHGATILRAMKHMETAADAAAEGDLPALFKDVGWAIMGVDGGATGPLLGTLFMSMSDAAAETETIDGKGVAALFAAALKGVQRRTKAQVGDCTMIDALVPAVEAMQQAAEGGADARSVLEQGATAAEAGALATRDMVARFGRAKALGEKTLGEQDPGATSMSLIIRGFANGVNNNA